MPRSWPNPIVKQIQPGFSFCGNGWTLSSTPVPHAQPFLVSMAFRIETNGKSFVYSGDTSLCSEMNAISKNADLLIHWCYGLSHETKHEFITKMSPCSREIAEMAKKANVKSVLLTHIRKHMDIENHLDKMLSEGREVFEGSFNIAEDLMVINL